MTPNVSQQKNETNIVYEYLQLQVKSIQIRLCPVKHVKKIWIVNINLSTKICEQLTNIKIRNWTLASICEKNVYVSMLRLWQFQKWTNTLASSYHLIEKCHSQKKHTWMETICYVHITRRYGQLSNL